MDIGCLLKQTYKQIAEAEVDSAYFDAEALIKHVCNISREQLFAHPELKVTEEDIVKVSEFVERRKKGEPIAYILGHKEFMSLEFVVNSSVLVPRPETEQLVELIISESKELPEPTIFDVGTGSGAIAVSLAHYLPYAEVGAFDISKDALQVATDNAFRHEVLDRVSFVESDLLSNAPQDKLGKVDCIAANLPYIPSGEITNLDVTVKGFEPLLALDGGKDGLDYYRRLKYQAQLFLKPQGKLIMEIGYNQGPILQQLFADWLETKVIKDLAGKDRFVLAQRCN